jgi:hypothetical protein
MVLVKTSFSSWCLYTRRLKGKLMRARMANLPLQSMLNIGLYTCKSDCQSWGVLPNFGVKALSPDVFLVFVVSY